MYTVAVEKHQLRDYRAKERTTRILCYGFVTLVIYLIDQRNHIQQTDCFCRLLIAS